jgi:asparagine synthetase B (glutamine-hydrolysing)
MCGLFGTLAEPGVWPEPRARCIVEAKPTDIAHSHPDDQEVWDEEVPPIVLGQRQLSIVGLSPRGHQPLISADGHFAVVYNGEIHNHVKLGQNPESEGCHSRSTYDTEVLLESVARWESQPTCRRFPAKFAFVGLDTRKCQLWPARHHLATKPLYAYRDGREGLLFAAELKARWEVPGFAPTIASSPMATLPVKRRPHFTASKVSRVLRAMLHDKATGAGKTYPSIWDHTELLLARTVEHSDRLVCPPCIRGEPPQSMLKCEPLCHPSGGLVAES